jgi:hypothetical protein
VFGDLQGREAQDGPTGEDQLILAAPVRLEGLRELW